MKNLAAKETDWDPQAYRELIAAVITLAVEDLSLPKMNNNRISAERFLFGDHSDHCDKYLMALEIDPQRFRLAVREKLVDDVTV